MADFRPPILRLHADELVVDNFAGGGGASLGIEMALGRSPDIAVNHDPEAIAMHAANHPGTRHFCESVWTVDPKVVCGGRKVALAWFSPDCKHFSKAKGGKPVEKKIRGLAWVVVRWAKAVQPRVIILENVEEFQDWGPLLDDGRPCPLRRGLTFRRWVGQLRAAGYVVEARELRASDYGAPTTRKRLFVIARSDGLPIVWPEPTHGPGRLPYRTAAECISWDIPCPSIFDRRRPLAEATQRRIARGIRRYVVESADPFIVPLTHQGDDRAHSIHEPMRTVTSAHRGEQALIVPAVVGIDHRGSGDSATWPADEPLTTITAETRHALMAASLVQTGYGEREGQAPRCLDLGKPLGTVVGGGQKHALVAAFLAKHYGGHEATGSRMQVPVDTITSVDHHALVQTSLMLKLRGGLDDHQVTAQDHRQPAPTLTAHGTHLAEVRAFLVKYYGTDQAPQLRLPLSTITSHDRFGLVVVRGQLYVIDDIGMRMLWPRELFRAQGFPDSYVIQFLYWGKPLSKTAQVRMVGNSVSPVQAEALVRAQFAAGAASTEVA
jgi:DNA (cytosine-5)-methyltransferase 1